MAVKPLTISDNSFSQDVIASSSDKPVLVDFWAEWCGPCKMIAPTLEQIASENSDRLKIVKLNVDENPQTARNLGIMGIPTLILFKDGKAVKQIVGNRPKDQILAQIEKYIKN
ncbi:thioredoxin [Candidatus Chlorohelix sp.]|uniref:thioredoxin n=1 Tax=Candidatus Chlorohelix sp. TaxID=3139201 RepID=UPI003054C996